MNLLSHPDTLLCDHIRRIAAFLPDDETFALTVKYHDLGKIHPLFQEYIRDPDNYKGQRVDHALISAIVYLLSVSASKLTEGDKEQIFSIVTIVSHHGILRDFGGESDYALCNVFYMAKAKVQWQQHYKSLLQQKEAVKYFGLSELDFERINRLGRSGKKIVFDYADYIRQKELFSSLIYADKYEAIFKETPKDVVFGRGMRAFKQYIRTRIKPDIQRTQARKKILRNYLENPHESIYSITAPTGIGKTLISLNLALLIQRFQKKTRVIYALPFTSIIDQCAKQFMDIYPKSITVHHHKVRFGVEKNGKDEEDNNADYDRMRFLVESWSEGFIVSTFFQLIHALFSNENAMNVKFHSLKNSVIVMDEVQAIPVGLWKTMQELLPLLAQKMNATFILMSATMPIIVDASIQNELADKTALFQSKNRYRLEALDMESVDKICKTANK